MVAPPRGFAWRACAGRSARGFGPRSAGKRAAGARDIARVDSRVRRKGEQQRLLRAEVIENAGEEFGLGGDAAKLLRREARSRQETVETLWVVGKEGQGRNGQQLGALPALVIAQGRVAVERHSVAVSEFAA
jgi:hypothetical protein